MNPSFRDELVATMPAVRGFARTFERDPARADDLIQDTMMKAWASRDHFRQGTNMKAWLFTILRNGYISEYRKARWEVDDADGSLVAGLSEKGRQEGHMAIQDLRSALAELPIDQREAVILVGAAGCSYEEAAEIVDAAVGTVKSRVNRARVRLAELMGDENAGAANTLEAATGR
jgi:RNA polymerase sigma-70 factor (ECF subfamily)